MRCRVCRVGWVGLGGFDVNVWSLRECCIYCRSCCGCAGAMMNCFLHAWGRIGCRGLGGFTMPVFFAGTCCPGCAVIPDALRCVVWVAGVRRVFRCCFVDREGGRGLWSAPA